MRAIDSLSIIRSYIRCVIGVSMQQVYSHPETFFWLSRSAVFNSVGLAAEPTESSEFFPPAPNAGAGSKSSVISGAKEVLAHSFGHATKPGPTQQRLRAIFSHEYFDGLSTSFTNASRTNFSFHPSILRVLRGESRNTFLGIP